VEGEREGGGKVVGWERVETMVAGRFCGEMFACSGAMWHAKGRGYLGLSSPN